MFTSVHIEGNLVSEELLQQVAEGNAAGQKATDFGLEPGSKLTNEIEYAWSRIRLEWKRFSEKKEKMPATDPYGTTLSRKWMEEFFGALGFELDRPGQGLQGGNGQRYVISHIAENPKGLPVHIVGFVHPTDTNGKEVNTLDVRSSGGASRLSPHSTVQEYLNVTDHVYGLVTNGLQLRLLRDSGRLVKFTYIEFDLRQILDQDQYADFTLLYRLLHNSRFGTTGNEEKCWLEEYYKESIETGNRIRDGLSKAVKEAITALGNGFVTHSVNYRLRESLASGQLTAKDYYRELLRLIYRLLFLLVTEERDLLYDPEDRSAATTRFRQLYKQYYSLSRLRKLSEQRYLYNENYIDLWPALLSTFRLFEAEGNGKKMGIQPLGGDLFSSAAIPHLENCTLTNRLLLECIRDMNEFTDPVSRSLVVINYRALDVEELGSVYEGLLDLHPVVQQAVNDSDWSFTFQAGTERKTTGSYYTRPELVNELIKSALIPVIEERLQSNSGNSELQAKALLSLKVCDAAAGSGHMLLAAARTIAWYLARVQTGDENPGPSIYRSCLRQVIQHCIYAVDYNPDAVELCKLALWLESHYSGKPLSFLDHKIRNGNSLVGVTDLSVLQQLIPDEAYNYETGDDKSVCSLLKKKNKNFKEKRQGSLFGLQGQQVSLDAKILREGYDEMDSMQQDTLEAVQKMSKRYNSVRNSIYHEEKACHIWTAAFFKTYTDADDLTNPTSERLFGYLNAPTQYGKLIGEVTALAENHKFFHWILEFPDVFEQGGFDVMLGNPPWEQIQPEEQEFFLTKDVEISKLEGSKRKKAIENLAATNAALLEEWRQYQHMYECISKFCKHSKRFVLSAIFKLNTYPLFTDLAYQFTNNTGGVGLIIPSAISTTDSNKFLFEEIINNNHLYKLFDFLEARDFFHGLESRDPFCIFILLKGRIEENRKIEFVFKALKIEDLFNKERKVFLEQSDFNLFNPNTRTCPIFYTQKDYVISKKIYKNSEIIITQKENVNPYNISFKQGLFNMTSDSHLFKNKSNYNDVRLYEAKLIHLYNHRWSSLVINEYKDLTLENYYDPKFRIETKNYISFDEFIRAIPKTWQYRWFLAFRNNARSNDERSGIFSIIPFEATGNSAPIIFTEEISVIHIVGLIANLSCLTFDYILRQKIGGANFNFFIVKQLPLVKRDKLLLVILSIISRLAIELIYTAWDIKAFADDVWKEADEELKGMIEQQWKENRTATGGHEWAPPDWCEIDEEGCPLPPFKWDEERRAVLKAELDAIYAKLYGLTTEELRYILDPQDVYGPDFPGETFRVLKEKEIRQYGEYRTRRLVLEAWERLNRNENKVNV
jgi:hypothetical protein